MDNLNDISAVLAYLVASLLGWAIWADVRHDLCRLISGRNVVLCAMAAWYLLEAIMLPEGLRQYTQAQYNLGLFYVVLALAGFLGGYHQTSGCSLFSALGEKITFFDDERWLWRLVWVGAMIGFAPIVYFTGTQVAELFEGILDMRVSWGGVLARGRYGDFRAAILMLEMFIGGVSSFAAILLFRRGSRLVQRLVCGLVVIWPILRAFGSGTRSPLITSVGSLLAVFYWKAAPPTRKKMICAGLLCVPLIYGLMAALVISRSAGSFSWEDREKAQYVGNEMFRELLFIISKVSSGEIDFQYGYVYYVQLVNPIPRFLWPDKPTLDTAILMANSYGAVNATGEAYVTISPGLIGEMYLNFGLGGILGLSFFGGWVVKGWDQIPRFFAHSLPTMVYYSAGLGVLFIMGRSFTMGMFYGLLSLAFLAWWIRYWNPDAVIDGGSAPVLANRGR
jgi:oligosaccharide repeat unit polymerase